MKKIAIIGAKGYVGSTLYQKLSEKKSFEVQAVDRKNYDYWKKQPFDIVINAAMPSARFWANNNPTDDFIETVAKTADIVNSWSYKKIIQISTISARTELDSFYGRHKKAAEELSHFGDNLIVRLTATFGRSLTKGALIDILEGKKVYVDKKSRYGFASLDFVCQWIVNNTQRKGIVEVGARNSISLEEITQHFRLPIMFEGRKDIQEVQNPSPEFPDARDVLSFLENKIKNS